jgi:RNA polymerase sigma factor (sigma-70 family)
MSEDTTAYDLYMKNLSKVKRLTNAEQRALVWDANDGHANDAFGARIKLQEQALLLVMFIFQRMQTKSRLESVEPLDMDAIQEANLAALQALPNWDPVRGTLATWLIPHIRGALLDYANTHTNGGIGSKHNKLIQVAIDEVVASEEIIGAAEDNPFAETSEPITLEESLVYESEVFPNAEKDYLNEQVRRHAWQVTWGNYLYDMLDGFNIKQMADARRVSQETIRLRLRQAEEELRDLLEDTRKVGI